MLFVQVVTACLIGNQQKECHLLKQESHTCLFLFSLHSSRLAPFFVALTLLPSSLDHSLLSFLPSFVPSFFIRSQCEIRILAHLSNDGTLLAHFKDQENGDASDIYKEMAAVLYDKSALEVTGNERALVKRTVVSIMYGQGASSVAKDLKISISAANMFKDKFFKMYKRVKLWMDETKRLCREKGYVVTLSGRRRYLSDIHSKKEVDRARAERQSVNSVIQVRVRVLR